MPTRPALLGATMLAAACWAFPVLAQPVTGLYVGAAGGANFMQSERQTRRTLGGVDQPGRRRLLFDSGYVGLAGIGYGFGNGLRVEVEGSYRNNRIKPGDAPNRISIGGHEQKYGAMVNALFDLDIGSPYVFPYLGGGLGYQWVDLRSRRTLSAPGGATTERLDGTDASFAYQGIFGLSFPVPPVVGLSLTTEYRFMGLTGDRDFGGTFGQVGQPTRSLRASTEDNYNHSLLIGLRYAFNVPRPAPAPVPVPAAAQAPQAARTYLVFFDWDRADLTDRARGIIAEAAQATSRTQVTRIEVAGHADRSGLPAYNQGLSQRRARNVMAELVRLGVAQSAITVQAFGESRPLVATDDGVREPQNRQVEIVFR